MDKKKRELLFRLIPGVILIFLIGVLVTLFLDAPGSGGYDADQKINQHNAAYASGNSFGFTDRAHTKSKPGGVYRIAVLGDSFIWGDGVPYDSVWSHRLEGKLLDKYDSVEVLHWGKSGWSTLDEFEFFRKEGKDYDIDLLLIGWVDNDPDMRARKQVLKKDPSKEYPLTSFIWPGLAQKWVNEEAQTNYNAWIDYLYTSENLLRYQKMLTEFHEYSAARHTDVLFVMTPGPFYEDQMKVRFDSARELIAKSNFNCLDLFDSSRKKLAQFSSAQLMANPVNGHPGVLMTEEFATEVFDFLDINHVIPKKKKSW
jgi:hypothetical protein